MIDAAKNVANEDVSSCPLLVFSVRDLQLKSLKAQNDIFYFYIKFKKIIIIATKNSM